MLPLLSSMDSIHKLLNIVLPLISLLSLFIFLPPILLFKISSSILRSVFSENVSEKVVLITGASSGIGKHLAYEYAKGGACLVLVARRQKQLQEVACKARQLGSPDVIIETGDVSKVEDCKQFVDAALNHFGRLDHLVNNAGIGPVCMFEDATNVDDFAPIMNINFWGSVYCTHFAIPHLRKSRGKIVVIASIVQLRPIPRVSIYSASKGALVSFYETLRVEVGSDIGITIVAPGLIDSEMTKGESTSKAGMDGFPVESTEGCTKAIFKSICRGDRYLIEPAWVRLIHLWNLLCPEAIESFIRWVLITRPNNSNPNPNSGQLKAD
ncbi:11-beta-hydroxysteroid dehydrogenase-like 2 isoform X1 [Rhododendron vialii]|uniref:11-beta-hydroxysteroid dehydrogenase-like 2 isoform X1 n=1 Tax=Rhododendron vialii TaxID=182163 RepID=UPI00266049B0|nr:11-beta-hydroxysteroid dehydrogenase-like 2 isoform X1 [Rhododendron vialii]